MLFYISICESIKVKGIINFFFCVFIRIFNKHLNNNFYDIFESSKTKINTTSSLNYLYYSLTNKLYLFSDDFINITLIFLFSSVSNRPLSYTKPHILFTTQIYHKGNYITFQCEEYFLKLNIPFYIFLIHLKKFNILIC